MLGRAVAEPSGEPPFGDAGMPAPLDQRHVRGQRHQRPLGRHHPPRQVGHGDLPRPTPPQPDEGRPEHDPAQKRRRHRQHPPPAPTPEPDLRLRGPPEGLRRTLLKGPRPTRPDRLQDPGGDVGDDPDRLEPEALAEGDQVGLERRAGRAAGQVRLQRRSPAAGQLAVGGRRQLRHRLPTAHRRSAPRPVGPLRRLSPRTPRPAMRTRRTRAWKTRLLTVPSGTRRTSAASR